MTEEPADLRGLSGEEVAARTRAGQVNAAVEPPGRSLAQIIRANLLTPVNATMATLFVLVLISGNWRDGLFVGVVLSNTIIGVTQEVRARRELARLQVLTEPTATVVRDGEPREIDAEQVVLGDVVHLAPGAQVPADGEVVASTGLQMDESMLTGESRPVDKRPGDRVLSGSFAVAGSGHLRTTAVGAASYASALATEAKAFSAAGSHLRRAVDRILAWLAVIIPFSSVFLLLSLLDSEDRWQDALQGTVAAAVAMVPDGLVLLTSLAFLAGIVELSRRNALAKQLSTVETLARVDTLCLDKTGTITTGEIAFTAVHPATGTDPSTARRALAAMAAADDAPNATMRAIRSGAGEDPGWEPTGYEPFSSERKWSAAGFGDRGWFYLGAPDRLLGASDPALTRARALSAAGRRILAIGAHPHGPAGDAPPTDLTALAVVELDDEIRPDAGEILAYFADQEVRVMVISGDDPETVAVIAERAGLRGRGAPIDARDLPGDGGALGEALMRSDVLGRVTPRQKQGMVRALRARGHVVAMTGDGVNDVLALKEADLGIAMGSGSPATRSVADLVLTDDAFSSLPVVVDQGRKVINNVERVANLFVTKAAYAVVLTLAIGILGSPFPLLPRQLTLVGTFSIGVPGFFLALAPETRRVRPGFLRRVLRFSLPAGLITATATLVAYELARGQAGLSTAEARSLATITLLGIGLAILAVVSRPLRPWKVGLVGAMAAGYGAIVAIPWLRDFFRLDLFTGPAWAFAAAAILVAGIAIAAVPRLARTGEGPD